MAGIHQSRHASSPTTNQSMDNERRQPRRSRRNKRSVQVRVRPRRQDCQLSAWKDKTEERDEREQRINGRNTRLNQQPGSGENAVREGATSPRNENNQSQKWKKKIRGIVESKKERADGRANGRRLGSAFRRSL
jgi:hypothetical protein